jgi:protein involved in ribonucleotide reduction
MTYAVIYFSRTGTSRRIAEKIAKKLSVEPVEVTDNMDWDGTLGYMRAARYAMQNKDVTVQTRGQIGTVDEYIVITPMWCGKITPAIRILLQDLPKDKVNLIVSSGGMNLKERDGYLSVLDIMKKDKNEDQQVDAFVGSLSA